MATLKVDTLDFHFQPNFAASKYDDWDYHRPFVGRSAVDVVAFRKTQSPPDCWLIEAKDFRVTWDGLKDAAVNAANSREKHFAQLAVRALKVRVVLHTARYSLPWSVT